MSDKESLGRTLAWLLDGTMRLDLNFDGLDPKLRAGISDEALRDLGRLMVDALHGLDAALEDGRPFSPEDAALVLFLTKRYSARQQSKDERVATCIEAISGGGCPTPTIVAWALSELDDAFDAARRNTKSKMSYYARVTEELATMKPPTRGPFAVLAALAVEYGAFDMSHRDGETLERSLRKANDTFRAAYKRVRGKGTP